MRINLTQARGMLSAMGYECDLLDQVADIPEPAIEALRSAWESARLGHLQQWEINLSLTRLIEAAIDPRLALSAGRSDPL